MIWSTFPIATSHLIGLTLHRLTGLPWIADFRDPMLQPSYPTSQMQRKAYQWIERQTITRCTRAVFTTHSAMEAYKCALPGALHHKFSVIENGYDEDGFDVDGAAPRRRRRRAAASRCCTAACCTSRAARPDPPSWQRWPR